MDRVYVVKPEEVELMRRTFADYLSEAIMKKLTAEGKTPRNGRSWCRSSERKVLENYSYIGNPFL